jgi:hypothetical protein
MESMSDEQILKIALEAYPVSEYWIGDGVSGRLYDENLAFRTVFIEGFKAAIESTRVEIQRDTLKQVEKFIIEKIKGYRK